MQCPICGSNHQKPVFQLSKIPPFVNVEVDDYTQARETELGEQHLVCCCHCGFVFNRAFKSEKAQYSQKYHAEQGKSPCFERHMKQMEYILANG